LTLQLKTTICSRLFYLSDVFAMHDTMPSLFYTPTLNSYTYKVDGIRKHCSSIGGDEDDDAQGIREAVAWLGERGVSLLCLQREHQLRRMKESAMYRAFSKRLLRGIEEGERLKLLEQPWHTHMVQGAGPKIATSVFESAEAKGFK
jgi:hypothetical protein